MKKIFAVLFFMTLFFSCQTFNRTEFYSITETFSESLDEKVFSFGNPRGKNALIVVGIDRYMESIEKELFLRDDEFLAKKFINVINAETLYGQDGNFDNGIPYAWKNKMLTMDNSNFLVMITNNKLDFFDYVLKYCKKNKIKFDYFLMDFHGSPEGLGAISSQKTVYRAELIKKMEKQREIAECFSKNCSAIAFSCNLLNDKVSIPSAVFFKTITGISNFSASKNITLISLSYPRLKYKVLGEFEKISDYSSSNLFDVYYYYKKYVSQEIKRDKTGFDYVELTLRIPKEFTSDEYEKNKDEYELLGYYYNGKTTVFYKNKINNKILVNFRRSPWAEIDFYSTKIITSEDFSLFLRFFLEIHQKVNCYVSIE